MINIIHDHQFKASGSHLYAKIGHVWVVRGIFAHFGHQTCLKIDSTHKKRMKSEMSFFILHTSSFPFILSSGGHYAVKVNIHDVLCYDRVNKFVVEPPKTLLFLSGLTIKIRSK